MSDTPSIHPVKAARQQQGLSRLGLAFKAGVSLKTIELIEGGKVQPQPATQRVIADVLGADPDDLFERAAA